ncbi:MAG: hypothetical protein ACE5H9_02340 [Anaerolineae bacterium]
MKPFYLLLLGLIAMILLAFTWGFGALAGGVAVYLTTSEAAVMAADQPLMAAGASEPVDAEEEYYRGLYDNCLFFVRSVDQCAALVIKAKQNSWFEKPSINWHWPLSAGEQRDTT